MVGSSAAPGPPQQPVQLCLKTLDGLVSDALPHLRSSGADPLHAVRASIASADVDAAVATLNQHLPDLLQDQRLVFMLKKQQFIDALRASLDKGRPLDPDALIHVLHLAKQQLAPLALDAYPEAYTEFKSLLQVVVYAGNAACPLSALPPACTEWLSDSARQQLAGMVYQTARQRAGRQPPQLLLLFAYLLQLWREQDEASTYFISVNRRRDGDTCEGDVGLDQAGPPGTPGDSNHGPRAPGHDLESARPCWSKPWAGDGDARLPALCLLLLQPGWDAPPLTPDAPGVASFRESDIQALTQFVGSARRHAIAALRSSGNNLWLACVVELCRLRLDEPLLRELVEEYASIRGLGNGSSTTRPRPADGGEGVRGRGAPDSGGDGACVGMAVGVERPQGGPALVRQSAPLTSVPDGGGQQLGRAGARRSASQSPPAKLARCLAVDHSPGLALHPPPAPAAPPVLLQAPSPLQLLAARVRSMPEALGAATLASTVASGAPGFWADHPGLLFRVWAAQFGARLAAGDAVGAVDTARRHMGPLAAQHPSLQPLLKAAMAMLLPRRPEAAGGPAGGGNSDLPPLPSWAVVVGEVAAALTPQDGHTQPPLPPDHQAPGDPPGAGRAGDGNMQGQQARLVCVLRALLEFHRSWMGADVMADPFLGPLGITSLWLGGGPAAGGARGVAGRRSARRRPGAAPPSPPVGGMGAAAMQGVAAQGQGGAWPGVGGARNGGSSSSSSGSSSEDGEEESDGSEDGERREVGGGYGLGNGAGALPGALRWPQDVRGGSGGRTRLHDNAARLVEILAIPMSQALALLEQFGDVETAVNSAFG